MTSLRASAAAPTTEKNVNYAALLRIPFLMIPSFPIQVVLHVPAIHAALLISFRALLLGFDSPLLQLW